MPQSSLPPARQDADVQWLPAAPPVSASLTTSLCEPHRDFIEAQLRLRRNATAISRTWSISTVLLAPTTPSSVSWPSCAARSPSSSIACPSCRVMRCGWTTARARPPWCRAPSVIASPACSWPHCATRGPAFAVWPECPASKSGPSCTSRPCGTRWLRAIRCPRQPQGGCDQARPVRAGLESGLTLTHYGVVAEPARVHVLEAWHKRNVNSCHGLLKGWLSLINGVATAYLENYSNALDPSPRSPRQPAQLLNLALRV